MGPSNKWVEVQIRSERMNEIAEKGYAAHHKYKQGEQKDIGIDSWLDKLQEVLESNNENPVDFVENFKLNLYAKEIFVFTPTGEIKSLPKGATALDFAFSIHTEVGMKTRGARVNGKLVPLSRTLKSGENVEVITSENIKPTANWLDFVQTSRAKSKIKSSLNEEKKRIAEDGRETLRRKLKQLKITLNDKTIRHMLRYFNLNNSLDLFYRVGLGTINNKQLKDFSTEFNSSFLNFFKKRIRKQSPAYKKEDKEQITQRFDTLVFGKEKENLKHSLSPCCNPIAGDPVFGFVSVNEGIKVHKKDCPNALSLQSNFAYRIIKAKWVDSSSDEFTAILKLSGIDNMGIVSEVTQSISGDMSVNINKLSFDSEDGIFTGLISVNVKNKTILNRLINRILKVKGVDKVLRE
jgi:GTP pyrophosphokinase